MTMPDGDTEFDGEGDSASQMAGPSWAVRVPASSANLGSGFDVLGVALGLHAFVGMGDPPSGAVAADEHHPAMVAFRRAGGVGALWTQSSIPMARGLGYSGAVRVGGAAVALVQQLLNVSGHGDGGIDEAMTSCEELLAGTGRHQILAIASELEGHADNVAASLFGGVVVAADDVVTRVPLAFDPATVVWIPDGVTASTDHSRSRLSPTVDRDDAVFNLGRVATFIAACALGDESRLRFATDDRLHQAQRLAALPDSASAMDAALQAGVWAAWLSGSGPTVAMWCESSRAEEVAAQLPTNGHTKILRIAHDGLTIETRSSSAATATLVRDRAATAGWM